MSDRVIRVCARRGAGSGIWLARMTAENGQVLAREIDLNSGEVGLPMEAIVLEGQHKWTAAKPSSAMMTQLRSLTEAFDLAVLEGLQSEATEVTTEKPSKEGTDISAEAAGKLGKVKGGANTDGHADEAEEVKTEKPAKDADESDPNALGNEIGKVELSGISSCPKCGGAVLLVRDPANAKISLGGCRGCDTELSLSALPMPEIKLNCPNCHAKSLSVAPAGQLTQHCSACGGQISLSAVLPPAPTDAAKPKAPVVATEKPANATDSNPNSLGAKLGTASCPSCQNAVTLSMTETGSGFTGSGSCTNCSSFVSLSAKAGSGKGNTCPMCGGEMDLCGKTKAVSASVADLPDWLHKKITGKPNPSLAAKK